jgi:hypothetical protein
MRPRPRVKATPAIRVPSSPWPCSNRGAIASARAIAHKEIPGHSVSLCEPTHMPSMPSLHCRPCTMPTIIHRSPRGSRTRHRCPLGPGTAPRPSNSPLPAACCSTWPHRQPQRRAGRRLGRTPAAAASLADVGAGVHKLVEVEVDVVAPLLVKRRKGARGGLRAGRRCSSAWPRRQLAMSAAGPSSRGSAASRRRRRACAPTCRKRHARRYSSSDMERLLSGSNLCTIASSAGRSRWKPAGRGSGRLAAGRGWGRLRLTGRGGKPRDAPQGCAPACASACISSSGDSLPLLSRSNV